MLDKPFRFPLVILSIVAAVGLVSDAFSEPLKAEEGGQHATTHGDNSHAINIIINTVAQDEKVPLDALRGILKTMGEEAEKAPPEEIQKKLTAKAAEFKALTARLNNLSNADPEVARLRQEAAQALEKGRFTEADGHLAMAEARDLNGLVDLKALVKEKSLSAAESRAQRAAAALLRLNPQAYREAAAHYAEAARMAREADAAVARQYAVKQGDALLRLGNEFGESAALREAIQHFREMLAATDRTGAPLLWAETQVWLGNALSTLGERESGTETLAAAVQAYREALKERTRERVPLQWAMTQNNLGAVLRSLGERESGTETLSAAVQAYREALKEYARERVPLQWAMTQNNLGNALSTLGARESGTETLSAAVQAYREALKELTRERVPLQWAMTQNNLGAVLQTLGERESGTETLSAAVQAYREALKEYARERVPLDWAMTQNNLGNALRSLGARESGTETLAAAVQAYREALKEYARERVPLQWAMTQNNLGNALSTLGARESGTETLAAAVQAYREALKELTRERVPLQWAMTQNNLGAVLQTLGERQAELNHAEGCARLREAHAADTAALDEFVRDGASYYEGVARDNLRKLEEDVKRIDCGR